MTITAGARLAPRRTTLAKVVSLDVPASGEPRPNFPFRWSVTGCSSGAPTVMTAAMPVLTLPPPPVRSKLSYGECRDSSPRTRAFIVAPLSRSQAAAVATTSPSSVAIRQKPSTTSPTAYGWALVTQWLRPLLNTMPTCCRSLALHTDATSSASRRGSLLPRKWRLSWTRIQSRDCWPSQLPRTSPGGCHRSRK